MAGRQLVSSMEDNSFHPVISNSEVPESAFDDSLADVNKKNYAQVLPLFANVTLFWPKRYVLFRITYNF
jgi:hypothetical protein